MSTTENAVNPAVETIATVSAVGPVGTVAQAAVAAGYSTEVAQGLQVDIERIIARYPAGKERSALIPMLHLIQSVDGYVSPAGIALCAARLGLERAEVSAVATFYSQFRRHPVGTYHVGVCTNALCAVMGGDEIWKAVTEHTGLGAEETSEDGTISLERVECNAACDYAPVAMVNWEFFDDMTPEKLDELIAKINNSAPIPGTIDLGLSVLWSDAYLGARTPLEFGDYYAWGELKTKEVYDWSNYKFARPSDADPNKYLLTKYCIHENFWGGVGPMDNKKHLDDEDDVAKVKLGGKWRMPTVEEVKELCANCTWELKDINNVRCLIGTSKLTGKTITLSFSGYRDGDKVEFLTEALTFWSNEIDARVEYEVNSHSLVCIPSFRETPSDGSGPRYLGLSIRPVLAK